MEKYTFDNALEMLRVFERASEFQYAPVMPVSAAIEIVSRLQQSYEKVEVKR